MEEVRDQLLPIHLWLTTVLFWTVFSTALSRSTEADLHVTMMWAISLLIGSCLALMALMTTLARIFGMMETPTDSQAAEEQRAG